ncbi:MAG: hypothetical protein KGL64_11365 [Acidobacteriota bacterium]|nr:hypothetical protein [Acidobacteriota bacterium]
MHQSRTNALIAVIFVFASAGFNGQQPFVHGSDIKFSIETAGKTYNIGDKIVIRYTIRNVSNGALYVPAGQWEIKCGSPPHLWSRLEDRSGRHYEPGYAGSCFGPNPIDRMSLSERMRKDALLLRPGQAVTGSFTFDSSVFEGSLGTGAYRLEAILYGWNQSYDNSQRAELAGMGAPFLIGESNASLTIELSGARK